ncbi:hypothetical protein AC578_7486 [Pseudocercospora eumusae]|uniref:Uncharacterized protein n=1 Tax=Pseudocercospora eumusae TaxID=321146 RepID=A0A139GWG8_9PEZI|nr:hypothetical protein AC578_7486 [Pseudocercospora eumusae]
MDATSAVTGFLEKRVKKVVRARRDTNDKLAPQLTLQTSPTMATPEAPKLPRTCIAIPLTSNPPLHFAERQPSQPSSLPPSIQSALKQARGPCPKRIQISPGEDRARMLGIDPDSEAKSETAESKSLAVSGSENHEAVQPEQCNHSTRMDDSQESTTENSETIQPEEAEHVLETDDSSESATPESSTSQAHSCEDATETPESAGPTSPLWDAVQSEEFQQALEADDSSDTEDSEIWECHASARIAAEHESFHRNKSQNRRQKIFERPQELDSMIGADNS